MWRTRQSLYLEPGEVAAVAEVIREAAQRQGAHPRQGLLLAAAEALEALVDGGPVMAAPAPRSVARWAVRRHFRTESVGLEADPHGRRMPSGAPRG